MAADARSHWDRAYREKPAGTESWYEQRPDASLEMVRDSGLSADAAILDVGGGASHLAGALLGAGFSDLTVLDVSSVALQRARSELGAGAEAITWVVADVRDHDFGRRFELWHDRAVFHFMVEEEDREAYLGTLRRTLSPGGDLVLATFGPDGPQRCSGLPVRRYDAAAIAALLGEEFEEVSSELRFHRTPSGVEQQFQFAHFRRRPR